MLWGMTDLLRRPWPPAKVLAAAEAAALGLSGLSLLLLLVVTPPFECGTDYASPTTPLHSGGIALGCFLAALAGVLVSIGMLLSLPRDGASRRWAAHALTAGLITLVVAGGALFADAARWTCWP
jgi:hypothetical protein